MADIIDIISGINPSDPINLAVNIILSTIVGGIILVFVVGIISKGSSERVSYMNAFLLVLIINIINFLGIIYFLQPYLEFIPYISLLLPVLVWIGLVKVMFGEMKIIHVLIVAVIGYAISILVVPTLVGILWDYIPSI